MTLPNGHDEKCFCEGCGAILRLRRNNRLSVTTESIRSLERSPEEITKLLLKVPKGAISKGCWFCNGYGKRGRLCNSCRQELQAFRVWLWVFAGRKAKDVPDLPS